MITETKINNIYDLITLTKRRPGMYIGEAKISTMHSFLDGYTFCSFIHNIRQEDVFPQFWYFHEWAMHKYGWGESTAGWKRVILTENNYDEEKALEVFFEMMDEFKTLHPISIKKLKLTQENLDYHKSEKCIHKNHEGSPVYEHIDEILLVNYSHTVGFSYFLMGRGG